MAIDVTVTEKCDRCRRKEQIVISSDRVADFEQRQVAAEQYQTAVKTFVNENQGKLPDLVVIFKGKVQMLSGVCDAHCTKTVQNNVDALFREHKPRQQKTPEERAAAKAAKEEKAAKAAAAEAAKNAIATKRGVKDNKKTSTQAKDGKNQSAPPAG